MAASFPTALQRTSDERWVTLDAVVSTDKRLVARILEAREQAAVVRLDADAAYDAHLRRLLQNPPPDAGRGVHMSWPTDLLHDLDAMVVGYTSRRHTSRRTFPLADFVDPVRRTEIAPLATRRHLLAVGRHTSTAMAALHHAGHGSIRAQQFRVDERARIVVVRVDELTTPISDFERSQDERRLGNLLVRLLGGQPWSSRGQLGSLLRNVADPNRPTASAQEWYFAQRDAEKELPDTRTLARTDDEGTGEDQGQGPSVGLGVGDGSGPGVGRGASSGRGAFDGRGANSGRGASDGQDAGVRAGRQASPAGQSGRQSDEGLNLVRTPVDPAMPTSFAPVSEGARLPLVAADPFAANPFAADPFVADPFAANHVAADHAAGEWRTSQDPRPSPSRPGRVRVADRDTRSEIAAAAATAPGGLARPVFAVATALTLGAAASVAPFAAFLVVAVGMITASAVRVGVRKSTRGPHQTVAIFLSRLVPFATGGLALAAFILLDLLLILGLFMALASRMFDYGPGFTLTWVLQLPEVPGLVRAFAFVVAAFGGMTLGGQTYDRIRAGGRGRRMVATPAIALAVAVGILLSDASIVWWPLPGLA